ncbi:superoxide dismutase [Halalkalibacter sp. AB-rgal2]|uniref:superoxide dismutase n=1 Tax=Halalkalibacter sp. AB-rgal2 TaxID=3242695 RepID=UPI00359EC088
METHTIHSQYVNDVLKWAEDLKRVCYNRDETLVIDDGEFTSSMNELINELEKSKSGVKDHENQQLYTLAMNCYESWHNLQREKEVERGDHSVPIGGHILPPLPYRYEDLEPYIDRQTMKLHHMKHHQSYVDGLNKAEKKVKEARETGNYDLLKHWKRELAFHGAGHYLHTIFWTVMNPNGGGQPEGMLKKQIEQDFGSFNKMKEQFSQAAEHVEGGGWALLVWSPRAHRLEILQAEKHQNLTQQDVIPLLVLDVWEHAYYLRYQNERNKYIEQWWNVVYWPEVEKRFKEARKVKWTPY